MGQDLRPRGARTAASIAAGSRKRLVTLHVDHDLRLHRRRTASASRSVPVAWPFEVMTASPPKSRTASAIRSSSVATSTRSRRPGVAARARAPSGSAVLSVDVRERLPRQSCGAEARGDDRDDGQIALGPRVRNMIRARASVASNQRGAAAREEKAGRRGQPRQRQAGAGPSAERSARPAPGRLPAWAGPSSGRWHAAAVPRPTAPPPSSPDGSPRARPRSRGGRTRGAERGADRSARNGRFPQRLPLGSGNGASRRGRDRSTASRTGKAGSRRSRGTPLRVALHLGPPDPESARKRVAQLVEGKGRR